MEKGDKVADFTLKDTNGNNLTLYNYLRETNGKGLILFFPLAFSSVCTSEMCHYRDSIKLYNSLSTNILGVSIDSYFTLREFKKINNLPFSLVSDFNKEVSRQFNVLCEDYFGMKGVSKRSAFVINQEKVVEYAEIVEDSSSFPDYKAVLKTLEE